MSPMNPGLFEAMWQVLLALAPWMLLGMAIAGLLHGLVPRDFIRRHLGGGSGVAKAVALGVPLPLCSCGVIPAGIGLKRDGASSGAAVGFLISTPQTGVDSVLVTASFLGWPFALFKVVAAGVTGLVGGWITDAATPVAPEPVDGVPAGEAGRLGWREMLDHALDILRTIWRWIVFGVVASAAIEVFVPDRWFTTIAGWGDAPAILAALAVSVPLYVCATASVPIAAALIAGGFPTGAALVFLMAGPATNVATIGAIFRAFGGRTLSIYLATIIVGSVGFGLAFDFLLDPGTAATTMQHEHAPWWAVASAIVFCGLMLWFAVEDLRDRLGRRTAGGAREATIEVAVAGMKCGNCASKLGRELRREQGVFAVDITVEPGRAVVRGVIDEARVRAAVERAGFVAVAD
jgi:uncharacterized membrane protein YraQ (UPF0718 family)/copper chaperone CopZ